ncbi:hypothetical protein UPYG_G00349760 [Umbra pygmaea]|uniref:SCP domain-containing protein n=1 Tax=Umbra pygmaea TaxID=75934 RepID=A0ABD0VYW3_UMBPY
MSLFICVVGLLALLQPCYLLEDIDTNRDLVVKEIVSKHNDLRRLVQPPASNMLQMNWNSDAAFNAKRWANRCTMKHSPRDQRTVGTSECGENMYMSSNKLSWSNIIQSWYNEGQDYSYRFNRAKRIGSYVGHYIRMVWADSNQIGCAAAQCPTGKFMNFYVCHYCPRGNLFGKKPYKTR